MQPRATTASHRLSAAVTFPSVISLLPTILVASRSLLCSRFEEFSCSALEQVRQNHRVIRFLCHCARTLPSSWNVLAACTVQPQAALPA
eukprot:1563515-Amphidinium_carterae.1